MEYIGYFALTEAEVSTLLALREGRARVVPYSQAERGHDKVSAAGDSRLAQKDYTSEDEFYARLDALIKERPYHTGVKGYRGPSFHSDGGFSPAKSLHDAPTEAPPSGDAVMPGMRYDPLNNKYVPVDTSGTEEMDDDGSD
jgi:hypothetical protein